MLKLVLEILKFCAIAIGAVSGIIGTLTDTKDKSTGKITSAGKKIVVLIALSAVVAALTQSVESYLKGVAAKEEHDQRLTDERRTQKILDTANTLGQNLEKQGQDLDKQGKRLSSAADSLEELHGELNSTSSHLTQRVQETGQEVAFSSVQLDHMNVAVTVVGLDRTRLHWTKQEQSLQKEGDMYVKSTCFGNLTARFKNGQTFNIPKPWEPPADDECGQAIVEMESWGSFEPLLSFFDPSRHLNILLILYFNGLRVEGTPEDCDVHLGYISRKYRCLAFTITARSVLPVRTTPLLTGAPHFLTKELGFALQMPSEGWEEVFDNRAIYGRDVEPQAIELSTCDLNSESDQLAERRLAQFQSKFHLRITVTGFEVGSEQSFWRSKVFAINPAKTRRSRFMPRHCRVYTYDPLR